MPADERGGPSPSEPVDEMGGLSPSGPADGVAGLSPSGAVDEMGGLSPSGPADGVAVRTLVVRDLPLLVASVGDVGRGPTLLAALEERGVVALRSFLGAPLPQGAKVGFMLDKQELKLVDDADDTLLRAARAGIDTGWLEHARRLKGTMTVVLRGPAPDPELEPGLLARLCDERAAAGLALGAIIGVAEERPSLPLIF